MFFWKTRDNTGWEFQTKRVIEPGKVLEPTPHGFGLAGPECFYRCLSPNLMLNKRMSIQCLTYPRCHKIGYKVCIVLLRIFYPYCHWFWYIVGIIVRRWKRSGSGGGGGCFRWLILFNLKAKKRRHQHRTVHKSRVQLNMIGTYWVIKRRSKRGVMVRVVVSRCRVIVPSNVIVVVSIHGVCVCVKKKQRMERRGKRERKRKKVSVRSFIHLKAMCVKHPVCIYWQKLNKRWKRRILCILTTW